MAASTCRPVSSCQLFLVLLLFPLLLLIGTVSARPADRAGEWHTTSWDTCEPDKVFQQITDPDDASNLVLTPTVGLQRRTLTCISVNATVLHSSRCLELGLETPPQHQRRCIVHQPCRVESDWSPWLTIQQGCRAQDDQVVAEIRIRQRRIIQAPIPPPPSSSSSSDRDTTTRGGDAAAADDDDDYQQQHEFHQLLLHQHQQCPPWEEKRIIDQPSQLPLCNQRYKWQPSMWSACRADQEATVSAAAAAAAATASSSSSSLVPVSVCGGGVQMRSLTCLRLSDSRPVNPQLCRALNLLPIVQHCEIPCDSDCQVGEWSAWSPCAAPVCIRRSRRQQQQFVDKTNTSPDDQGDEDQGDDDRGGAVVDGQGKQTKQLLRDINQGEDGDEANDATTGYQLRHRQVTANASADGTECPPLSQLRRCNLFVTDKSDDDDGDDKEEEEEEEDTNRSTFSASCARWEVLPLLDVCHLDGVAAAGTSTNNNNNNNNNGTAAATSCGRGYHELAFRCQRYDGVTVDDEECANTTLPPMEQVTCTVHCPDECVLSPWSQWTPCSAVINHGRRTRTRTRFVVAMPTGHQSCPSQEDLVQEEPCTLQQLQQQQQQSALLDEVYSWLALPWQRCRLPSSKASDDDDDIEGGDDDDDDDDDDEPSTTCGNGLKRREVRCTRVNDGRHVDDSHCRLLLPDKPTSQRPCAIPCPVECHLSDWSEWSPCSSDDDAIQSRIRVVLHQPNGPSVESNNDDRMASNSGGGGAGVRYHRPAPFTCPPLVEKRSCYDQIVQQERIQWQMSEWSSCQPPVNAKCGTGIATRSVYCRDGNNGTLHPTVCLRKLMDDYRRIETHRSCHIPCKSDNGHRPPLPKISRATAAAAAAAAEDHDDSSNKRRMTDDVDESQCRRNCLGTRNRSERHQSTVRLQQSTETNELEQTHEITATAANTEECPCERITLELEDWSTCLIEDQRRSCGAGTRYRRRKCIVTSTGQLAPLSWCNEEDYETRDCVIECPVDCRMSAWSRWSPCNSTCGPGFQTRSREIEVEPSESGRPCGSIEEVQACNVNPCDAYEWRSSDWTPCHLEGASRTGSRCGDALQTRYVRCVNVVDGLVVDDAICDPANKPSDERPCRIACPGECVISPWSTWTTCNQCQGERKRHRTVIRQPIGEDASCPHLVETQPCWLAGQCWTYNWRVSEWSSCLPLGGSQCGEGVRNRIVSCMRNDGYVVHPSRCDSHTKPTLTEMWCHVECAIDCHVSPWSAWDDSECASCGHHSGLRSRHREILMANNQFGRNCPSAIRQQLPCPYRPCYEWRPSIWSQCSLDGAQCGTGVRHRLMDCVVAETARKVDPQFCLLNNPQSSPADKAESSCKVLCSFEKLAKVEDDVVVDGNIYPPAPADEDITVFYYPNDGEFSIWMISVIAIGSLFLVFVGVTIFLICSSREETEGCKRNASVMAPSEFRTRNPRTSERNNGASPN